MSKNESHNEYSKSRSTLSLKWLLRTVAAATRQASFAMTATGNAYDMRAYTDIRTLKLPRYLYIVLIFLSQMLVET